MESHFKMVDNPAVDNSVVDSPAVDNPADYYACITISPAISKTAPSIQPSDTNRFNEYEEADMNPEHNDSDTHTGEAMADAPAAGEDFNAVLAAAAVRNEGAELGTERDTELDTERDADAGEEADPMNDDDAPLRVRPSWGAALSQLPGLPAFEISFADMGNSAARVVSFKTSGDVEEREVIYRGDARRTRRVEPQYPSDAAEDIDNMDDGANHYADEALENDDDGVDNVIPSREHERTLRY